MSRCSTRHLLSLLTTARNNICAGQYRHMKTGITYNVMGIALEEKNVTPVVVYSDANNIVWVRDFEEFKTKFEFCSNVSEKF